MDKFTLIGARGVFTEFQWFQYEFWLENLIVKYLNVQLFSHCNTKLGSQIPFHDLGILVWTKCSMTMSTLTLSICSTEFSVPTNHFYAIEYSPYMAMYIFSRSRKKHRGNIFVFLHSISSKLKTNMLPVHLFVIYFPYFSFWCLFPM